MKDRIAGTMDDKTAKVIRGVIVNDYNGYTYDVKEKFIIKENINIIPSNFNVNGSGV